MDIVQMMQVRQAAAQSDGRDLLANVLRWSRRHGWKLGFWGREDQRALRCVEFDPALGELRLYEREPDMTWWPVHATRTWVPESIREAVDVLVLWRVLPVEFGSAWRRGYVAGRQDRLTVHCDGEVVWCPCCGADTWCPEQLATAGNEAQTSRRVLVGAGW